MKSRCQAKGRNRGTMVPEAAGTMPVQAPTSVALQAVVCDNTWLLNDLPPLSDILVDGALTNKSQALPTRQTL
jgi:hypothetical protein